MSIDIKKVILSVIAITVISQTITVISPSEVQATNSGYVCLDTDTFYDPNAEALNHKTGYCENGFAGLKIPTSGYICTDLATAYDPNVASTVAETDSTYHKLGYCANGFVGKKVIMGQPVGTNDTTNAGSKTDSTTTDTTGPTVTTTGTVSDTCNDGFLGFPAWYRGLTNSDCEIITPDGNDGRINLTAFIWRVVLNVIEMAMVAVAYVTVAFIIYGGFQFFTSQGAPEAAAKARTTILNAVIGLVISLVAVGVITFISDRIL